jgi:CheY-like chemotaxis protein
MPSATSHLLVVDDELALRQALSEVLTAGGYRVRLAEDGISALSEMERQLPELIVSDLNMPGMSGFEFLAIVRERFPAIPVVAMSAAFSGNNVPSGVAADAFYAKTSGISGMLQVIHTMTTKSWTSGRASIDN